MKILVSVPTIIGGVDYQPSHIPQDAPDNVAQHMIDIGNATAYQTKVMEVVEKKTLSASQQAPVLPKKTAPKRKARKPKSSQ